MFYVFFIIGFVIRLILIPLGGFKADVAYWKGWGLAVVDKGIVWLVNNTNYNYPPGFAYILWTINKIYGLFLSPYNINEYWLDNNIFYLFLIKSITILADLLVVYLIVKMTKVILGRHENRIGIILALFYFLNPATIYDGAAWGQVDQLGLAVFLLSVYLIMIERPRWASVIFSLSLLLKFQNIIFIPLFYLYLFKKYSFKELIYSLTLSFSTFLIVTFPFFIQKQMDIVIRLLTINFDWFPWYSLNAFNGWWIVSGLKGMNIVDKHLIIGITSAKQFGLFLFIFAYFIASITLFLSKKEDLLKNFILSCTLAVFAFFHLLTQSHERYLFPILALFPIVALSLKVKKDINEKFKIKNLKFEAIFYLLISMLFFLNMYISMGWNYPDQVFMPFTKEVTLSFSWWISVAQIILFLIFFFWFFSKNLIKYYYLIASFAFLLVGALLFQNSSFILKKPVSLTQFKPVSYSQDYLEPIYDKTVDSARGVNYWNRLSVNYFFYEKGIGSHANSMITYHLKKEFSVFRADFGIDTEGDQSAKVYFSLEGDGRELYKSPVKGRFDPPGSTTISVKGIDYLTLKITKAGDSNFGAHADWLSPVLVR